MVMILVEETAHFIAQHEGFRSKPYICAGGVKTIGFGFTDLKVDEIDYKSAYNHLVILVKSIMLMHNDVLANLDDRQKIAIVSLIYNIGSGAFKKSTIYPQLLIYNDCVRNLGINHDSCVDVAKNICMKISLYKYSNKRVLAGLVYRRSEEIKYFASPYPGLFERLKASLS